MSPKKVDATQRRQQILRAAVTVFARHGFAASRIEDVADAASMAKGTVYLYFSSRDEILEAAFGDYAAQTSAALREAADTTSPAVEALGALIESTMESVARQPELARLAIDLHGTRQPAIDMAGLYQQHRQVVSDLLRRAIAEGDIPHHTDCDAHAALIVGALEGCVVQWLADPKVRLDSLTAPLRRFCLRGIGA